MLANCLDNLAHFIDCKKTNMDIDRITEPGWKGFRGSSDPTFLGEKNLDKMAQHIIQLKAKGAASPSLFETRAEVQDQFIIMHRSTRSNCSYVVLGNYRLQNSISPCIS